MGADVLEEMRRLAIFTSGVAELTRNRAEQVVKSVMSDHPEASAAVKQLVEISKQNRQELLRVISQEMHDQVEALGLATKADLERIERRLARLEERARSDAAARSSKKTTTTKSSRRSKKPTARTKTTARGSVSKRSTAKKSGEEVHGEEVHPLVDQAGLTGMEKDQDKQAADTSERVRAELARGEVLGHAARLETLQSLHEWLEAELDQAAPPRH